MLTQKTCWSCGGSGCGNCNDNGYIWVQDTEEPEEQEKESGGGILSWFFGGDSEFQPEMHCKCSDSDKEEGRTCTCYYEKGRPCGGGGR